MDDQGHIFPKDTAVVDSQWNLNSIASVWLQLEPHVNPFNNVLSIPGELFRSLDETGKCLIANTFMQHTTEAVMFCRDGTGNDRYFLGNPRHLLQGNGVIMDVAGSEPFWFLCLDNKEMAKLLLSKPYVPAKTKEKKVPRPPNAYILYRKERHSIVKEANPGIKNNEISQVLGSAWNAETREVRQKYKDMADEIKRDLFKAHPDYQYKPRKPSEKKRRARRNPQPQQASFQTETMEMSPPSNYTDEGLDFNNAYVEAV